MSKVKQKRDKCKEEDKCHDNYKCPNDIPMQENVKEFTCSSEWDSYGYPKDRKKADYYVQYGRKAQFGGNILIEASTKALHHKINQLKESAEVFSNQLRLKVDSYFIILDSLKRRDRERYRVKPLTPPFRLIERRLSDMQFKQEKIMGKPIVLIFRREFNKI